LVVVVGDCIVLRIIVRVCALAGSGLRLNAAAATAQNLRHSKIPAEIAQPFGKIADGINSLVDSLTKEDAKSTEALFMFVPADPITEGMVILLLGRQLYYLFMEAVFLR
jgi:hypothetical protein